MDPYHGFHRRFLNKRQTLNGVLESILGGGSPGQGTAAPAPSQSNGNPLSLGGAPSGVTSVFGGLPTLGLPSSGPSSATTSSPLLTLSSSSSTGSTIALASSLSTLASTSTTPTPTPSPTSSASDAVFPSSDGTRIVFITSTLPAASATAAHSTSFLQDPSLEGGVFTLVGILVIVIVIVIVTWTIRKRRRDRLERDLAVAVTFDPGATDHYERQEEAIEKHRLSMSSLVHGYRYGHGVQLAYAAQQEYHGAVGYGHPAAPYCTPPNLSPYEAPSPAVAQPAGQGGTNLTRKFSDRKPVPPLLPSPACDPSDTHVSIPPKFYQQ